MFVDLETSVVKVMLLFCTPMSDFRMSNKKRTTLMALMWCSKTARYYSFLVRVGDLHQQEVQQALMMHNGWGQIT